MVKYLPLYWNHDAGGISLTGWTVMIDYGNVVFIVVYCHISIYLCKELHRVVVLLCCLHCSRYVCCLVLSCIIIIFASYN